MFRPHPIGFLQFGLFWSIVALGAVALTHAFAGSSDEGASSKHSGISRIGIALQAVGFGAAGFGPVRFALPWLSPSSIFGAALVALFGGAALAIFVAARREMGQNWSVVARTRSDHQLVRTGPFARVRHPIYLALFLYLLSFAVGFGHYGQLLIAVPFYVAGAIIRIREEEKLLRAQFGAEHARYVREVPAFIPFIRRR